MGNFHFYQTNFPIWCLYFYPGVSFGFSLWTFTSGGKWMAKYFFFKIMIFVKMDFFKGLWTLSSFISDVSNWDVSLRESHLRPPPEFKSRIIDVISLSRSREFFHVLDVKSSGLQVQLYAPLRPNLVRRLRAATPGCPTRPGMLWCGWSSTLPPHHARAPCMGFHGSFRTFRGCARGVLGNPEVLEKGSRTLCWGLEPLE